MAWCVHYKIYKFVSRLSLPSLYSGRSVSKLFCDRGKCVVFEDGWCCDT